MYTACTSDVVASQTSVHGTVTSLLLCSFFSSLMSRTIFPLGLSYWCRQPNVSSDFSSLDRQAPGSPPTVLISEILCPARNAASHPFIRGCLYFQVGLFQRLPGFVDLVLHQVQFCASLHLMAGIWFLLAGNQFPIYGLAGFCNCARVDDDGATRLARISLCRTICQGFDQQVTTSLRWNPVVEIL